MGNERTIESVGHGESRDVVVRGTNASGYQNKVRGTCRFTKVWFDDCGFIGQHVKPEHLKPALGEDSEDERTVRVHHIAGQDFIADNDHSSGAHIGGRRRWVVGHNCSSLPFRILSNRGNATSVTTNR
jgi:hypothetical protein